MESLFFKDPQEDLKQVEEEEVPRRDLDQCPNLLYVTHAPTETGIGTPIADPQEDLKQVESEEEIPQMNFDHSPNLLSLSNAPTETGPMGTPIAVEATEEVERGGGGGDVNALASSSTQPVLSKERGEFDLDLGLKPKLTPLRARKYVSFDSDSATKPELTPLLATNDASLPKLSSYPGRERRKKGKRLLGPTHAAVATVTRCMGGDGGLTHHSITVDVGEDVVTKIRIFAHQEPRAMFVISAHGVLFSTTLTHNPLLRSVTYEGILHIVTLSGSFVPTNSKDTIRGGLSLTLSKSAGQMNQMIGGRVSGALIALTQVDLELGTFFC